MTRSSILIGLIGFSVGFIAILGFSVETRPVIPTTLASWYNRNTQTRATPQRNANEQRRLDVLVTTCTAEVQSAATTVSREAQVAALKK